MILDRDSPRSIGLFLPNDEPKLDLGQGSHFRKRDIQLFPKRSKLGFHQTFSRRYTARGPSPDLKIDDWNELR